MLPLQAVRTRSKTLRDSPAGTNRRAGRRSRATRGIAAETAYRPTRSVRPAGRRCMNVCAALENAIYPSSDTSMDREGADGAPEPDSGEGVTTSA